MATTKAIQTADIAKQLGAVSACLYGGAGYESQLAELRRKPVAWRELLVTI